MQEICNGVSADPMLADNPTDVRPSEMSILLLFELSARPDRIDDLKAFLAASLPDTRRWEGCESVVAHQDQDDPTAILLVQRWATRDHYARYQAWRDGRAEEAAGVRELVTGRPRVRFFDEVSV